MLTQVENDRFTRVGPGTPMGELLRRYWHPIAAVAEMDDVVIKPVRLMGEDLVLYKDAAGHYGLVDRHCPHRRADLLYGWAEECGIRCSYHGWKFDESGACVHQPFEETADPDARFKERIRIKAYRAEAKAGMIFAYMGPEPAPLNPTWESFTYENGFTQVVFADLPCNWLQSQENSIDPVHFEWLHNNWSARQVGRNDFSRRVTARSSSTSSTLVSGTVASSKTAAKQTMAGSSRGCAFCRISSRRAPAISNTRFRSTTKTRCTWSGIGTRCRSSSGLMFRSGSRTGPRR